MLFGAAGIHASPRDAGVPSRVREITEAALSRADAQWDDRAALLWTSTRTDGKRGHGVRPTSWYALGLLWRDGPGDHERAVRAFDAVLRQQLHEPGRAWNGTFYRRAEEPRPPGSARMWDDYDPNWRQFIGCVFAQALLGFEDRLPETLVKRMEQAIVRAIEGELAHGRLRPDYTNIALMQGFLLGFAGQRMNRPEWIEAAEGWVGEIRHEFAPHESFEEYNSPTYYGVDLYGLALLRAAGATPTLRSAGAEMEAALWRDIGRFYHAALRNMAGPYDRAYGMDHGNYVSLTGVWIGFVVPANATPLPDPIGPMKHGNDFLFAPCFALLGAQVPDDVLRHLREFSGERHVRRPIADGSRIATAWLAPRVMVGAQQTNLARGVANASSQFHPATIHWAHPDGSVGWIALRECSRVDAFAEARRLRIETIGDATFAIHAAGANEDDCRGDRWSLPGLNVRVRTDATGWSVRREDDVITIAYRDATRFEIEIDEGGPTHSKSEYDLLRTLPEGLLPSLLEGEPDDNGFIGFHRRQGAWYQVGYQRAGARHLLGGVLAGDRERMERAWTSIDAAFARQRDDGGFETNPRPGKPPLDFDAQVETTYFYLQSLAHALLVLKQSPHEPEFRERIASLEPKIRRAADFVMSGYDGIVRKVGHTANRLFIAAKALGLCGVLLDDTRYKEAARDLVGVALSLRDADGVFIEAGGRDSSYNAVSILMAQSLSLHLPDERIGPAMKQAMAWQLSRIRKDGTIMVEGNTRTGLGQERSREGGEKSVNTREVAVALCYHAVMYGRPELVDIAQRIAARRSGAQD